MSPPPLRRQRPPLAEISSSRSTSLNNSLGIRLVPYSPPRPDGEQSQSSSRNTSRQLSSSRPSDALLAEPEGVGAFQGSDLSSSPPSSSALFGSSPPSARGSRGVTVSDSDSPFQSSATPPDINTRSYYSPNYNINALSGSSPSQSPPQADGHTSTSPPGQHQRPWSKRRHIIAINSDKTFSLIPQRGHDRDLQSPPLSYSTTSIASDPFTDDQPASSPLTTLREHDRSTSSAYTRTSTSSPASTDTPTATATPTRAPLHEDPLTTSSPWNYRMLGGLRKVPKTPNLKETIPSSSASPPDLPPCKLEESPISLPLELVAQPSESSLRSIHTPSTTSETDNYEVHASTSPYQPSNFSHSSASDDLNYRVLGQSPSPSPTAYTGEPPTSPGSDDNYVVHGGSSPVSSSPVRATRRTVRQEYSQESLLVLPLQPRRKPSVERLGFYKSISRESLRRAASLKSITSVLSQEATHSVLLAAPATAYLQGGPQAFSSILQDKRSKPTADVLSSSTAPHMTSHPHQWSSQLSTVHSESEGGSEPASRSLSLASYQARRSSGLPMNHSRNMLSISSSIDERSMSNSHSHSGSVDRPQASLARPSQRDLRQIRDQDEHGDGLTDLLYYGSGERRFLAYSSESTFSEASESRPASLYRSGSPTREHIPSQMHSQRRRPKKGRRKSSRHDIADQDQMPHSGEEQTYDPGSFLRRQTSSLWSPHLRHDNRASRYSVWEPPSTTWSADGPLLGRRNLQVALFIVGFIFPFAWMAGACLPLPPNPLLEMEEGDGSLSSLDVRTCPPQPSTLRQEDHYEGARWWRRLNRYMSIVGLLVIGAVIALVVLGVRQGWGSR
ncbi:uncharacterized protein DNG_01361 [Cephalotrichum gorgonifer]|uniref:Serine-rich protein n=1 Tax=Cephalotrichum gorgonifer TaxID=2041049 RepID=A0AAE8MR03_9PEZI|nr:uncharacterized protein DNG_01361 [Cephalotrichum gorgonifer]